MASLRKLELALYSLAKNKEEGDRLSRLGSLPPETREQLAQMAADAQAELVESIGAIGDLLRKLQRACSALGLRVSLGQAKAAEQALSPEAGPGEVRRLLGELARLVENELSGHTFFFVPPGRAKYATDKPLAGAGRLGARPAEDMAEAAKCFAFARYTACVFHLMRVMEAALPRLARVLGLTLNLDRPWGQILRDIDAAVAVLPGAPGGAPGTPAQRARHVRLAGVCAYLHHVKDAWRNTTMHPKRTYTEEEARHLFHNVLAFTQSLHGLR
jgi:hypothetical protein